MPENDTPRGFSTYCCGRLVAVAAVSLAVLALAAPVALACAEHTPPGFWTRAFSSLDRIAAAVARAEREQPKARGIRQTKWITGSRYERTTDVRVLFQQGCRAGRLRVNGLVILAFGKPA